MRIRPSIVLVCLLAVSGAGAPAAAQELAGCQASKQWTIDRLGRDHVKLVGQVEVDCGDMAFFADEIEIFSDTNRLIATGNVVFTSGNNRIAAERLEFNTETKLGTFYDATGSAAVRGGPADPQQPRSMFGTQEPDIYFYGATVEKIGAERYRITRGGFTTCVQPTPRWQLTSGTVTINLDHYAILTNSLFKVKGVPVLYLPVFYYPIQEDDRATGFLIPAYGTSTIRGQTVSNAFFWAVNRSQDVTVLHDWYSRTGQGYGTEYRYSAAPGSDGYLRYYNLREHEAEYTDSAGEPVLLPERKSYEIRGAMSHRLGRAWRARGRADYFSDITVQQTYHQNVYEASRRQRIFSGSMTGNLGIYSLIGSYDRSEYFFGTTSSTVRGGTPRLVLNRAERPVGRLPIYVSLGSEYTNLLYERRSGDRVIDQGLRRVDLQPRVRVPFTAWPFLTVNSSIGWRFTRWSESLDPDRVQIEEGLSRRYFDFSSQVTGPVFNRIWNRPGSSYAEKLKHSIEPFFAIQRVTAIDDFDRIVQLDGVDTIVGSVTRVNYGLVNRLYRKPGGGGRSREVMTAAIGQSWYTDARAAQYDRYYQTSFGGTPPSKFSPLSLHVRSWPTDGINAQFRAEYDTQFNAFRTMSADSTVALGEWLHATAGWSQRRFIEGLPGFNDKTRLDHYLNQAATVRLKQNRFGGVYTFNYDVRRSLLLQQKIVGYYNAQCCGFAVEYQTYDLTGLTFSPVEKDRRFNFSFTLAGIGTFSNFFGALGGAPR